MLRHAPVHPSDRVHPVDKPESLLRALIYILVYGGVCAYLFDTMRAFQWLALGSVVGSAVALTPEYVDDFPLWTVKLV